MESDFDFITIDRDSDVFSSWAFLQGFLPRTPTPSLTSSNDSLPLRNGNLNLDVDDKDKLNKPLLLPLDPISSSYPHPSSGSPSRTQTQIKTTLVSDSVTNPRPLGSATQLTRKRKGIPMPVAPNPNFSSSSSESDSDSDSEYGCLALHCTMCPVKCSSYKNLGQHMQNVHFNPPHPPTPKAASNTAGPGTQGKRFGLEVEPSSLLHNFQIESGVETIGFNCSVCHMEFHSEVSCNRHFETEHEIKPFQCEDCKEFFKTTQILAVHNKFCLQKKKKKQSSRANQSSSSSDSSSDTEKENAPSSEEPDNPELSNVTKSKKFSISCSSNISSDSDDDISICKTKFPCKFPECRSSFSFSNKYQRESHYRRIHKAGKFQCQNCYTIVKSEAELSNHMKLHKEADKCLRCNLIPAKVRFSNHLEKCHYEKNKRVRQTQRTTSLDPKFKCEYCSVDFLTEMNRDEHVQLAHRKNRNGGSTKKNNFSLLSYSCSICKRDFAFFITLRKHYLTHNSRI